jgi:mannose-6-phosphate isomerase-like protein (cupin superfamily)
VRSKVSSPETEFLPSGPDDVAPDGSEVRLLAGCTRGGLADFRLAAGQVARAVAHRTVEELWYVTEGSGQMWRQLAGYPAETVVMKPGLSLSISVGTAFQFRADDGAPLAAVGVTMPPWPGAGEAEPRDGIWPPTVQPPR